MQNQNPIVSESLNMLVKMNSNGHKSPNSSCNHHEEIARYQIISKQDTRTLKTRTTHTQSKKQSYRL